MPRFNEGDQGHQHNAISTRHLCGSRAVGCEAFGVVGQCVTKFHMFADASGTDVRLGKGRRSGAQVCAVHIYSFVQSVFRLSIAAVDTLIMHLPTKLIMHCFTLPSRSVTRFYPV